MFLLVVAVGVGAWFQPGGPWAEYARFFTLSEHGITTSIALYGFVASVLPVWMLLCPRDYLSSYMKVGTIAAIVLAVLFVRPELKVPAFSTFIHGGGPIVPGALFPFVFITIACGAISGFHALVSSGTTPKMIDRESSIRAIGYGAMLMESLVGVTALIAASSLFPADYYQINLTPAAFADLMGKLKLEGGHLGELARLVGEPRLEGRTGGGVSLAVGIAQVFGGIPGLRAFMGYFYHFVIMFEALFVGTTTLTGGFLSIRDIFVPMWLSPKAPADSFKGLLNSGLTVVMMTLVVLILMGAVPLWFRYWKWGRRETLEMLRELPRTEATGA